jgi:uncharacterized membrane protein
MKHLALVLMIAILSTVSFAAGKAGKTSLEQRVAEIESQLAVQVQVNQILQDRTDYLKYHIDALESNQRVNRASR